MAVPDWYSGACHAKAVPAAGAMLRDVAVITAAPIRGRDANTGSLPRQASSLASMAKLIRLRHWPPYTGV